MSMSGRDWIEEQFGADAANRVGEFLGMVVAENTRQNLIAPSTIDLIWERHAQDSAQLLRFDQPGRTWLDVGTGGGFPGMIVALLRRDATVLVEPRGKRAMFLADCVERLALDHVRIVQLKVERLASETAGIISARAVSAMGELLAATEHLAIRQTRWVLPRGRSGRTELEALRRTWHGMFHVEQSVADPSSTIVILEQVQRR